MTTEADALILRYLQHLESQLGDLPANRRQELLDEVQEHITTARADLDPETEAGVLTLAGAPGRPGRHRRRGPRPLRRPGPAGQASHPGGWRSRPSSCW
jgi:hypothetical protein